MPKEIMCCLLAILVAGASAVPLAAQQQRQTVEEKQAQKIRKFVKVLKRWDVGDPVTVKLNDGTTVKGHITEVEDNSFVVTNRKTGQSSSIEYKAVKDIREGIGTRTKIGIVFAGAVLAFLGICAATHGCRE